jgi:hypothetical protein
LTGLSEDKTQFGLLWIFILFLMLPLLAFPEIIFGGQTLYWADLSWIHYPRHIFAAEEWLAGRVPLWDPYQHTGLPFLAESQVGALYPVSALFLSPFSPSLELSLFILLHLSLATLFTFMLARTLGMGKAAATLAGLAFGCGGFLMAQVTNLNIMTGGVWLPLILLGLVETSKRRSRLAALLAGIPLALQILTAQPQVVFYTLVTLAGYSVYRLAADFSQGLALENQKGIEALAGQVGNDFHRLKPRLLQKIRYALQTLLLLSLTSVTGLLLAAPQVLPTLELQQLSVRSEERGFDFLTKNSLPPAMWLNLLLPSAFGNNVTGFEGGDPFQEDFIYIGFIPLLFVFFSGGQRFRRDMPFFILLLIGGAGMAMGRFTPLYELVIQHLPGFALFRIPARWLMVVNLALAILAGFGLETLRARGLSRSQWLALVITSLLILVSLAFIWIFGADLARWSNDYWSEGNHKLLAAFLDKGYTLDPRYQSRLLLGWAAFLIVPVFLLVANVLGAMILFSLLASHKISTLSFSWLVVLLLSLDLMAAGGTTINPTQPIHWWGQLSGGGQYILAHLGEARVFPLGMGSEKATVTHLGQYFPSVYRVRSAGGHGSSLMLERLRTFLQQAHPVQAIQLLGVRYLLTEGQMGADVASTYPIAYGDDNAFIYENKDPLPRVFVVHEAIRVDTPTTALDYFKGVNTNPSQTVVLETVEPLPPASLATGSQAVIARENPQRIEIAVKAAAAGYVVLLDTFYPGWTATLDGQLTQIYPANVIGRAVFVPAGQHTVVFEYRPLTFRVGLWLSAGMWVVLTLTIIKFRLDKAVCL